MGGHRCALALACDHRRPSRRISSYQRRYIRPPGCVKARVEQARAASWLTGFLTTVLLPLFAAIPPHLRSLTPRSVRNLDQRRQNQFPDQFEHWVSSYGLDTVLSPVSHATKGAGFAQWPAQIELLNCFPAVSTTEPHTRLHYSYWRPHCVRHG